MNKIYTLLFVLSFALSLCAKTSVGVYVSGDMDENYKTLLGNKLVEAFTASDQYIAVNRSTALNAILKEAHATMRKGNVDYTQVVNATKQSGETQLCGVSVYIIDNMYIFSATLLDVLTNTVIRTASAECVIDELKYPKIVKISETLAAGLIPDLKQTSSDMTSVIKASELGVAAKEVQKNKKYNIPYAAFKQEFRGHDMDGNYKGNHTGIDASDYYLQKSSKSTYVGHWLWVIPPFVALAAGAGVGLTDLGELNSMKAPIVIGAIVGSMLPTFSCYIAGAAYKRQAWKEYKRPYNDALKDYNRLKKEYKISLRLSPAVGYDWAGAQVCMSF